MEFDVDGGCAEFSEDGGGAAGCGGGVLSLSLELVCEFVGKIKRLLKTKFQRNIALINCCTPHTNYAKHSFSFANHCLLVYDSNYFVGIVIVTAWHH